MIVFLEAYKTSNNSHKKILEDYFSCAVNDLLENKESTRELQVTNYINFNELKGISKEFLNDTKKTRKFIERIINEKIEKNQKRNKRFMEDLYPYLIRNKYVTKLYKKD